MRLHRCFPKLVIIGETNMPYEQKYQPPRNWSTFQRLCQRVLQRKWKSESVEIYGAQGQQQRGVDLLEVSGLERPRAAQCKLYDRARSLSASEIKKEVNRAKTFSEPLGLLLIMTTARPSTRTQEEIVALNKEHQKLELFEVGLMSWEDIENVLNENPDIAEDFSPGMSAHSATSLSRQLTDVQHLIEQTLARPSALSPAEFDAEIDSAVEYIKQFEYQLARLLLERLRARHWDKLSNRQRFRVMTNISTALLGQGEHTKAAAGYLEAKPFQPHDQQAAENEALAYQLLGDTEKSLASARAILQQWTGSARAVALLIENAGDVPLQELEKQIPKSLEFEPQVCSVMARRSAQQQDFNRAEQYARHAFAALPKRAHPTFLLGQIIFGAELAASWRRHAEVVLREDSSRVHEALTLIDSSISLAEQEKLDELRAQALVTRSCIYEALGHSPSQVEADVREAQRIARKAPVVAARFAEVCQSPTDIDAAISSLRGATIEIGGVEATFLLSNLLTKRGSASDLKEALQLLSGLVTTSNPLSHGMREQSMIAAIGLAQKLKEFATIEAAINNLPSGTVSSVSLNIFQSWLAFAQGQQDEAVTIAEKARAELSDSVSSDDKRNLAMLLSQLGRFADALPLWLDIAPTDVYANETRYLLDCAIRLDRHGLVLDICEKLRANGVTSSELFQTELGVLQRYAPEKALIRIDDECKTKPNEKILRLHRSFLALHLGRNELVDGDPSSMPQSAEIKPHDALFAVLVMRATGHADQAVPYAYDVLRRNFNDIDAHRAYRAVLEPSASPLPKIPNFDAVEPGAAARIGPANETSGDRWIVIEDSESPDSARNELLPGSALAQQLRGKKVGELLELPGRNQVVVKQIVNKYVYRWNDCLEQWAFRFSDNLEVIAIRAADQTGRPDFTRVLAMLKEHSEDVQRVHTLYSSSPVPIHAVAAVTRRNDIEALADLAGDENILIRCCDGSGPEREDGARALASCSGVVIDTIALGTLMLLDQEVILESVSANVIVARSTLAQVEEMLRRAEIQPSASLGFTPGAAKPTWLEYTPEANQKRIDALRSSMVRIKSHCDVRDSTRRAYLEPEKRKTIEQLFGQAGADSVLLAMDTGSLLWTDDLILAACAKIEYGIRRIWTQLLLQERATQGTLDGDIYFTSTAKMAGWGYFFTSINAFSTIRAGELADWNLNGWPLKQTLQYLAMDAVSIRDAMVLTKDLILAVYKQDFLPERRTSIVIGILEHLAHHEKGREAIIAIRTALPIAFGLNVVHAEDAMKVLTIWLASRKLV